MSKKLIEELSSNGMVVVFDVDGVLAPYEWGLRKHCMSDKEWTSILESGVDMYSHVKPIKCMQDFIKNKKKLNMNLKKISVLENMVFLKNMSNL